MRRIAKVVVIACLVLLAIGIPAPAQQRGRGPRGPAPAPQPGTVPAVTFTGVFRGISGKTLSLENADGNTLQFYCSKKTKYLDGSKSIKPADLKRDERISVEARRAPDLSLDAVTVRVDRQAER
jgi:hypothetical protein